MSYELFSHGLRNDVFYSSKRERIAFPNGDLVKVDYSRDELLFARLFYKHKIASLLLPDNTITVVGTVIDRPEVDEGPHISPTIRQISQMAPVSSDHAIFSQHTGVDVNHQKNNVCECEVCRNHREYHLNNSLEKRALAFARGASEIGVGFPADDPTDYCLNEEKDTVLFFEIDRFDVRQVMQFLSHIAQPTRAESQAFHLAVRYKELYDLSLENLKRGGREFRAE